VEMAAFVVWLLDGCIILLPESLHTPTNKSLKIIINLPETKGNNQ